MGVCPVQAGFDLRASLRACSPSRELDRYATEIQTVRYRRYRGKQLNVLSVFLQQCNIWSEVTPCL